MIANVPGVKKKERKKENDDEYVSRENIVSEKKDIWQTFQSSSVKVLHRNTRGLLDMINQSEVMGSN